MSTHLISPHGGSLVNLTVDDDRSLSLKKSMRDVPSWVLSERQSCDIELLINGAFSPLTGFMGKADYESVCDTMSLSDGTFWTIPITFDVPEELAGRLAPGKDLALRDQEGILIAVMHVDEIYRPDKRREAESVYGTKNTEHPGVAFLLEQTHPVYLGGRIEALETPEHYDFQALRLDPAELRHEFTHLGWRKVIAFQTRNPLHRAHFELTLKAVREVEANLLIHAVVGMTKPGDVDHFTRVRCYQAILPHYPLNTARLALLPLSMRMAGPREAAWHALIRKNHGCTHLIVGRDHAGPGSDSRGKPFYGPYDAHDLLKKHSDRIGMEIVEFKQMVYLPQINAYEAADKVPDGTQTADISGTDLRNRLRRGLEIPAWFTFPEVAAELRATYPPRSKQGFTVFFTGLSGSGKSTLAKGLMTKLLEIGGRPVTLLDGDIVRRNLSSELGFSKEHRDLNIRRIGFVASEITKNGGIAICAPIAPYDAIRKEVRAVIEKLGGFVLVYLSTPLETCEERDRKGLYAKARAGIIPNFTGISDPYEAPADAELVLDTTDLRPEEAVQGILLRLEHELFIGPNK
ncbi:MAG: bifunctional sulfate adenylyltransferase/adenylylsulfate kinase [Spirochaetales bacterium]|nr:bifunctional sulfate adenylyltransferase/adenylylsulfate kinase [Spirochaetales bacterium]